MKRFWLAAFAMAPASLYRDIATDAGFTQAIPNGGDTSKKFIVETTGSGVALFDFDNDGRLDILIASGPGSPSRLYRNQGQRRFLDISESVGLTHEGWAQGVCAADFDADGWTDLMITYWGQDRLYRNREGKRFERVHLGEPGAARYGSGCAWVDYDRDGDLDLFVANYLEFDPQTTPGPGANPFCFYRGIAVNCGPRGLPFARNRLWRNEGGGRFSDVSVESGIAAPLGHYSLGVVVTDADRDGWPDIYVACDSTPSLLFINQRDGTFREEGIERGIALNDDGKEQAGMGLGVGDYNLDGKLDIFKTHFADDTHILYRNEGEGNFRDVTIEAGLAVETRYVGWGAALADFDNDGWPDIFFVTGSVYPEASRELPGYPYESPRMLFRNLGNGRFEQIAGILAVDAAHSSRGMAIGDFDNDGDLDIVIMNRNRPPSLLRNDLKSANNWLRVRAPIGTRVTALYGGKRNVQEVLSQASFYSSNEPTLHFGLGAAATADLEIRRTDGKTEIRKNVPAKTVLVLKR